MEIASLSSLLPDQLTESFSRKSDIDRFSYCTDTIVTEDVFFSPHKRLAMASIKGVKKSIFFKSLLWIIT